MSGGGIGKAIGKALGGIGGIGGIGKAIGGLFGGSQPNVSTPPAQNTAQQEVDKKQQTTNAALARKKNRSVLSTGAASMDTGTAQQAKKLLGE